MNTARVIAGFMLAVVYGSGLGIFAAGVFVAAGRADPPRAVTATVYIFGGLDVAAFGAGLYRWAGPVPFRRWRRSR